MLLNEDGFKKFCREFERWISGAGGISGQNFRKIIRQQAARLKKALQNKKDYEPYQWEE